MAATLETESTLTDRYQTTVPSSVREALQLGKRDKLHYKILPGGQVVISKAVPEENDPLIGKFLQFLADDIATHPERIQAVDAGLAQRLEKLVGDIVIDLDEALSEDDE